jgi:RHS repeat-associated protein
LTRHQRSAFEPLARGQSPPWRVKGNGSDEVTLQVYPGTRYIDEIVGLRVKDQGRLYAHQDANWNVTALTDLTGRVIEQYWYSPYGQLEAHVAAHPFDFDDDGDVDAQDIAAGTSGGTCWGDYDGASGDCKRLDADGDRDIDVDDYTIVNNYVAARHSEAALQRIPAASHSRRGNLFAHQGLPLDAELASYKNRARQYAPGAKRFMQRDPMMFADGPNLYASYRQSPISIRDSLGLVADDGSGNGGGVNICVCGIPVSGCCPCGEAIAGGIAVGPSAALDCKAAASDAVNKRKEIYGNDGDARLGDAFLHCYGQCLATVTTDPSTAQKCGDVHEGCRSNNPPDDEHMDQHNNALGRNFGAKPGADANSCESDCKAAVNAAGSGNCDPSGNIPSNQAQTCPGGPKPPNPTLPEC